MMKRLKEIALLFFRLGATSFGGPAVHIAIMEREIVYKRKWMSKEHFLDLIGATNLIPGPNSTEIAMHCGHYRGGVIGMIIAGLAFILPAVILSCILGGIYQCYGATPNMVAFIFGVTPVVLSIIFRAGYSLMGKAAKNKQLIFLGILALIASLSGINEIIILLFGGVIALFISLLQQRTQLSSFFLPILILPNMFDFGGGATLKSLFIFLKVGTVLYGGGYVLFALLDTELVQTGIISRQVLIDAIAVGQFTPGPVLSTASFIGWQINGVSGALIATIGIFLPSFLFVAFLNPIIPMLRKSISMSSFLDGVNVVAVALIFSVGIKMSQSILHDWRQILLAMLAIFLLFLFPKINNVWIILMGAVGGYLLLFIH